MRWHWLRLMSINVVALSTLAMIAVSSSSSSSSSSGIALTDSIEGRLIETTTTSQRQVSRDGGQHVTTSFVFRNRKRRANMEDDDDGGGGEAPTRNVSFDPTNETLVAANGNAETTGISDKDIVLIVVCSAVLLVICLVGVALLAKCHWGKVRREDNRARYQGVLQRDSSANSPMEEQTSTTTLTNKDNDAHGHTNMFAQIDEIDEVESCPSSPGAAGKHLHHRISNARRTSQETSEFETKPLLTYTEATPTSRNKIFKESSRNGNGNGVGNGEEKLPPDLDLGSSATEIRVEIVPSPSCRSVEVERRMYCRTGLSQSDYSLSSFTSVNPSYHYGNQVGYMDGFYGYPSEVLVIDLGSPDYYADDALLLLPPSASERGIFPSQESDLDISVRAAKDSGSDEVTMDGTSMIGDVGGGVVGLPSSADPNLMAMDSGSDFSLDRLIIADDAYRNDECPAEDGNKLVTDISIDEVKSDSYELKRETEGVIPSMPSQDADAAADVSSVKTLDDNQPSDTAENVTDRT